MKFSKIVSIVASISVLAASLAPLKVSALSTASMTLSGATNNNGSFAVTVYENTGSDTVTGANVELSFSQAVSGVSYDYSVGPFTAVTPSGAHNAYGTVTGQNPVARVTFALANPGTVTATVAASSYLKHAGDTSVESFAINRGAADFTYTAPVTGGQGGGSDTPAGNNSGAASSSSNGSSSNNNSSAVHASGNTPANNGAVAAAETQATPQAATTTNGTAKDTSKTVATSATAKHASGKGWLWGMLIAAAVVGAAYIAVTRRRGTGDSSAEEVVAPAISPVKEAAIAPVASEKKAAKAGHSKSGHKGKKAHRASK